MKCRYCKSEHSEGVFLHTRGVCPSCNLRDMAIAMDCRIRDEKLAEVKEISTEVKPKPQFIFSFDPDSCTWKSDQTGVGVWVASHSSHGTTFERSMCGALACEDNISEDSKEQGHKKNTKMKKGVVFHLNGVRYRIVDFDDSLVMLRSHIRAEEAHIEYINKPFFENVFALLCAQGSVSNE